MPAPPFRRPGHSSCFAGAQSRSADQELSIKIGLLIPLQGPAGIWGPSCEASARLAVADLNASSGILGQPIELVLIDAAAPSAILAEALRSAVALDEISALVAMHTSDRRAFVTANIPADLPYVYTNHYEGGETGPNVFAIGETAAQLLGPGIAWLSGRHRARRWFLLGNDYVWPRMIHAVARNLIAQNGGLGVDEAFFPFGTEDFEPVFRSIRAARPDVVVMSLIGHDAVRFNRAFVEAGLAPNVLRFSTSIEENVVYGIGAENTENLFLSAAYFAHLRSAENDVFRERYHSTFGETPPVQNELGQSCYEGFNYLAALANQVHSLSAGAMRQGVTSLPHYRSARVSHGGAGRMRQIHVAEARGLDLAIVHSH